MNKLRRKALDAALIALEEQRDQLRLIVEDEQAALENMPDPLQDSRRGQEMQDGVDAIEDAISQIEDACDLIRSLIS